MNNTNTTKVSIWTPDGDTEFEKHSHIEYFYKISTNFRWECLGKAIRKVSKLKMPQFEHDTELFLTIDDGVI